MSIVFDKLLRFARGQRASDLILKSGLSPALRINGELRAVEARPLTNADIREFLIAVVGTERFELFRKNLELDAAVSVEDLGRYRINAFQQRRGFCAVLRLIDDRAPTPGELHLPQIARDFAMKSRGLVLVTGPAGCGKSTTIASMVAFRAERDDCHIITVEDPIEYLIPSSRALVDQREIGRDTKGFARALRHALRQDPDVIVVGEMRDLETIQMAITAAETGHLVLSTLHTVDAVRTIDRIVDAFPPFQQRQVRLQLSANLVGILSQCLVRNARRDGRVLATEVMICTPAIQNLIRESKTHMVSGVMQTKGAENMITMNRAFFELIRKKLVVFEDCVPHSPNPEELETLVGRRASLMDSILSKPGL